ncbi:unnamed protein product [Caenorhabditis brenneri]
MNREKQNHLGTTQTAQLVFVLCCFHPSTVSYIPNTFHGVNIYKNQSSGKHKSYYADYYVHYDEHVNLEKVFSSTCEIENWNNKSTDSFPFFDLYKEFAAVGLTGMQGLSDSRLRLLTAFLYENYIVITHTAQNPKGVGRTAFCHYYDCNRVEIPGSQFESFVFPMTAVHCPRRRGAYFVSLTFEEDEKPQEPIPLLNRIFREPPHEIGICVGPIYGEEKKWLDIIEYIEHHKLMGASIFYFTVLEMDMYSRRTIDYYQQNGEVEATFVNTEYQKVTWLFHMIQVHECFFRSKFHSKWVISTDIDERLVMTQMPLISYLRLQPPSICEINFGSRRVPTFDAAPSEYISEQQITESLSFLRYNLTSDHHWLGFKLIFRPDRVHMVNFHWTWRQYEGCHVKTASDRIEYIRHYRTTSSTSLRGNWFHLMKPYRISKMDEEFVEQLKRIVLKRVKYIYELHPVYCSSIDQTIRNRFKNDLHCV